MLFRLVLRFVLTAASAATAADASTIRVTVSPVLDPRGNSWRLQLLEEGSDGRSSVTFEGPVRTDGAWSADALRKGRRYRLRLKTDENEGWLADEKPFEALETPMTRVLTPEFHRFRGVVLLGKKPLAAHVTFEAVGGLVSIPFLAKEDGSFEGMLPRDGWWTVDVSTNHPHLRKKLDVRVDPPARDGSPPEVEVRLTSRSLEGEIVDENGSLLPTRAYLNFNRTTGGEDFFQERVEGGTFLFERFVPGAYYVSAGVRGGDSEDVFFTVAEGGTVDPGFVSLVIHPRNALRGRVVSPSGAGIAGAGVNVVNSVGGGRTTPVRADADGRFAVDVPGGATDACLVVVAPGFPTRVTRVLVLDQEQPVPVDASGGSLTLDYPEFDAAELGDRSVAFFADTCLVSTGFLTRSPGARRVIEKKRVNLSLPFIAPGSYRLCALPLEQAATSPRGVSFPGCAQGILTSGKRLDLRLAP